MCLIMNSVTMCFVGSSNTTLYWFGVFAFEISVSSRFCPGIVNAVSSCSLESVSQLHVNVFVC